MLGCVGLEVRFDPGYVVAAAAAVVVGKLRYKSRRRLGVRVDVDKILIAAARMSAVPDN